MFKTLELLSIRAFTNSRTSRIVWAWLELHKDELTADWDLLVAGEKPYKIDPL